MLITHRKTSHTDFFLWVLLIHSALLSSLVKGDYGTRHNPIDRLTQKDINRTVELAVNFMESMKNVETNILNYPGLEVGNPNHGVYISYSPEQAALRRGKAGWIASRSTQMMVAWHCNELYDPRKMHTCEEKSTLYSLAKTQMADSCKEITQSCAYEEYNSPYRSITGFCNHNRASKGESFTAYKRLIPPVYTNGIESVRRAVNKQPLPNAREISAKFTKFSENNHDLYTMAVLQWGQFIEQDMSRVAVSSMYHYDSLVACCSSDGFVLSPRYVHKFCLPVSVSNDVFYHQSFVHCMSYVRSMAAIRPDCSFGPNEQLNQATHFLDGSQIYGSSYNKSHTLRDFTTGELKMSTINNKRYLSLSSKPNEDCLYASNNSLCFMSGDPRVNFEPQIAVMHTLWAREHNRLVWELSQLNNTFWTADELFEEARRIVIAEIQHITYNEWIPEILAKKYIVELNKHSAFQQSIDPGVLNSVATAVFRAFKSLYPGHIKLYSESRDEIRNLKLQKHYYKPEILGNSGVFDNLVRGLSTQTGGKIDMNFPEDLINKLYVNESYGYDILTLDIQRGRDHGIPPYNKFRKYIGLKEATSFKDFENLISANDVRKLSQIYTNPDDVDLIIGGILERPTSGSLFGPTFSWLLTNQLVRTRRGDRYYYSNENQPKPFSPRQLKEIRKVTFARILCDNSDNILSMQTNVFQRISEDNTLVSCEGTKIPRMNLAAWSQEKEKYINII